MKRRQTTRDVVKKTIGQDESKEEGRSNRAGEADTRKEEQEEARRGRQKTMLRSEQLPASSDATTATRARVTY